jgi:methionyl-tRNA synthetase
MSQNKFYITTTLPYVNSDPHIGFAMEIIRADIIARYKRLTGHDVFFNTGTDEHGQKIFQKAMEAGVNVQEYVDGYAEKFRGLKDLLGISDINFIRTTDEHHIKAAQEFWKRCDTAGDIYKKAYKIKYCVGCELEKTESELVDGKCPIHPHLTLEIREEENYFFKFSKYQEKLLKLYDDKPDFVIPKTRQNEIKAFVSRGLEDFSISRLKEKMPWGVAVPGDDTQVMYVWFDALVNYISCLGWPDDEKNYEIFWVEGNPTQYAGKDNLRQQSAMWQAMLMSADLAMSYQIVIEGFITSGGQKMSKSLGNVVSPYDIVKEYGTDALRYYVAREFHPFEDSDFTHEKFKESYNANLANGIGNLTSRIMKLAETHLEAAVEVKKKEYPQILQDNFRVFDIQNAANNIWEQIGLADQMIQSQRPFEVVKKDLEKGKEIIRELVSKLYAIAVMLEPILPETSKTIQNLVIENKMPEKPLFLRKE